METLEKIMSNKQQMLNDVLTSERLKRSYRILMIITVRLKKTYVGYDMFLQNKNKYMPLLEIISEHCVNLNIKYGDPVIKETPNDKLLKLLFGGDKAAITYITLLLDNW